jgi:hypothetical protein
MQTDEVGTEQRRHGGGRWRRAFITVVVLVLLAIPWLPPAPTTVESIDPDGSQWVRVGLPEFYERGPDPALVVETLRGHGVPVEVVHGRDVTPWKVGRIIGVGGSLEAAPEAVQRKAAGVPIDLTQVDLTEYGIRYHAEGGYSVDPARFRGSVSITVAVTPWERVS